MTPADWILVVCILFYPIAKTCTDLRLFHESKNILYRLCIKAGLEKWYKGGNEAYNPSLIFTADFWHFFEHVKLLCIAALAGLVLYYRTGWRWWWILPIGVLIYGAMGRLFELLFRYVLPDEKAGSIKDWLRYTIFFWRNSH